ncbi:hypothetical protein HW555_008247 [Spodoptera exigua]|uniref:Ig-like domain-containing protein n=1 Tax=Spodoptera exigua TaxID=7107 RepID=A0A835L2X7_SPOEX|nr:hypothetical protein HW555_008247 [Spodoptera exigua]
MLPAHVTGCAGALQHASLNEAHSMHRRQAADDVNYDDPLLGDEATDDDTMNDTDGISEPQVQMEPAVIESTPSSYEVEAGSEVRLECKVTPERTVITWSRNNDPYFMGTMKMHPEEVRYSIAEDSKDMVIKNAKVEDSGVFRCETIEKNPAAINHTLLVTQKPSIVNMTATNGGTVGEGSDLTLSCFVTASPVPTVIWSVTRKDRPKNLEELILNKMGEMESQLQTASLPKANTIAKLAEEFRCFRELVFGMLSLLRSQIQDFSKIVDSLDMRSRRKALIFTGISENEVDCKAFIVEKLHSKLALKDITMDHITQCHRLGAPSKDRARPILVRFMKVDQKSAVWRAKQGLKGSSIAIKEFLTRTRQSVFSKARLHFGMRACWTQDGVIVIRTSDGSRHRISSSDELDPLLNERLTEKDAEFNVVGNQYTMRIKNVKKENAGQYYCYALNKLGSDQSEASVIVNGKPQVHVPRTIVNSDLKIEAVLQCVAHEEARPHIRWYKDGVLIEDSATQYVISTVGAHSNLTVSPSADGDFGTFTCEAENDYGTHNRSIELVQSPVVEDVDIDGPRMTWTVHSHQPLEEMEVQLKATSEEGEWTTLSVPVPEGRHHKYDISYSLEDKQLQPGEYLAVVKVKNSKSWGGSNEPAVVNIQDPQSLYIQTASVFRENTSMAHSIRPVYSALSTILMYLLVRML